jgi:photosystem II stability/assembly factor-like uncharacterized protein
MSLHSWKMAFSVCVLIGINSTVRAQQPTWTNVGPAGGFVTALAIDPSNSATLYAVTRNGGSGSPIGVFKSADGGTTWNAINNGLPINTEVFALAIDPVTPTTLYAGTNLIPSGQIFKSTDGGISWGSADSGLTNTHGVVAFAINSVNPTTLYAGMTGGVFKSTDGGITWAPVNSGLPSIAVLSLAIDPITPTTLYAGPFGVGGVVKTTNGGANWSAIDNGWPTSAEARALAIDLVTPSTLYAGTSGGTILKTIDGGDSWSTKSLGNLSIVLSLAIDPVTPTTLYAGTTMGVFKSTDGGDNWTTLNSGLTNLVVRALAIDPANPTTLYAGTDGGGVFVLRQEPNAAGTVIFSDYGPGNSVCTTCNWWDTGVHSPEQPYHRGMPFTVPCGTSFTLDSINVTAFQGLSSVPATYIVSVNADSGGLPGAVLEQFTFFLSNTDYTHQVFLAGTSALHPTLSAGTQYWLTTDVSSPTTMSVGWPFNNQGSTGLVAWRAGDTLWTRPFGSVPQTLGAFSVLGNPIGGSATCGPPTITPPINPTSGIQGQTIPNFTVNGSNFQPGATLSFSGDAGIFVNSSTITTTQVSASISIAIFATTGPREVIVTNPDGQSASTGFTVIAAPLPLQPVINVSCQGCGLPVAVDFGTVHPGTVTTQILNVSNSGTAPLIISNIISSNSAFTFSPASLGPLIPQGSATITVSLSPPPGTSGPITGVLTITSNAPQASIKMTAVTDPRLLVVISSDGQPSPGCFGICNSQPPLDIQPINNHVGPKNTVVTDFTIRNLTGTWYEVFVDNAGPGAPPPPKNAPNPLNPNTQQVPNSFIIAPFQKFQFPLTGDLTFSPGQYLQFRASDKTDNAALLFSVDMLVRGLLGTTLVDPNRFTAVISQVVDLANSPLKVCAGAATNVVTDLKNNSLDQAAWDDLALFGCVAGEMQTLLNQVGNQTGASQWGKINEFALAFQYASNFGGFVLPLAIAQLTADSPRYLLLYSPVPGRP